MKKLWVLYLIFAVVLVFASCKSTEVAAEPAPEPQVTTVAAPEQPAAEPVAEETVGTSKGYFEIDLLKGIVPGVLYQLNLAEGQEPIVRAVALSGNRAGSDLVNGKDPSMDGIRFVFELNEYVSFNVDSDVKDNLMVFAVPHRSNPSDYDDTFFQAIPDNMQFVGLNAPEEGSDWGDLFLNPDFNADGYYDLVFTDGIRPVAMVLTRFYKEGTVENISDEELERLMSQAAEDAKKL